MKISEALDVSDRSVSFREAEIFLQEVLQVSREFLHTHPEQKLTENQQQKFESFIKRRENNDPVAYITGHKEFFGRDFKTDARALIPRPETEALIELALPHLKNDAKILELGTGCGNIAVTLTLELLAQKKKVEIIATDISQEALDLAEENWQKLKGDCDSPILFLQADLFAEPEIKKAAPYDLIIANLPYVPLAWQSSPEAQAEVVFKEPSIALFGGQDGLDHYRNFFKEVQNYTHPETRIILEFGEDETGDLTPLAQASLPSYKFQVHPDYAGLDRVLEIFP